MRDCAGSRAAHSACPAPPFPTTTPAAPHGTAPAPVPRRQTRPAPACVPPRATFRQPCWPESPAPHETGVLRPVLPAACSSPRPEEQESAACSAIPSSCLRLRAQHQADGRRKPLPGFHFRPQLLPAGCGQRVELRPPVILRAAPIRPYPALVLQSVQRRVKRPLPDLQHIL